MPTPASPTVRRRRLAAELRRLREHRTLTGEDVADQLNWSTAKISRIENAKTGVRPADVRKLLELYDVGATHFEELLALARDAERKGWWEAYSAALPEKFAAFVGLEAEATAADQWESQVIPGLFQTETYARQTILAVQPTLQIPPSQVEARVEARLRRQEILTRDRPIELSVVLDESVLLRQRGDHAVMRTQLARLVEIAQLPNVNLRVLPLEGAHPIDVGSFTLLRFAPVYDVKFHDVIYVEQLYSNFYFEEATDTYRYSLAYERLTAAAHDPATSVGRITEIAEKFWR